MFMALDILRRRPGRVAAVLAGTAALATTGVALAAHTNTLGVAKHATITDQKGHVFHASAVVNAHGMVVYTLSGDSKKHPECTSANGCFQFWPPVTVKSKAALSRAKGVKGKLGTWKRGKLLQVTLDGHPLYTFAGDSKRDQATGEGLMSFGGTWHVRLSKGGGHVGTSSSSTTPGGGSSGGW